MKFITLSPPKLPWETAPVVQFGWPWSSDITCYLFMASCCQQSRESLLSSSIQSFFALLPDFAYPIVLAQR